MKVKGECLATTIGSLPHTDARKAVELILKYTPDVPAWPQLPKRSPNEGMVLQFTENMPGIERKDGRTYFDVTRSSFDDELIGFYSDYLAVTEGGEDERLERFGLSERYAAGIYALLELIPSFGIEPVMVKGQLTGPFTLGTSLTDQDGRCAYYNPQLRDVIVKYLAMNARWQVRKLSRISPALIFIDEPGMSAFGSSAFVGVREEDILNDLGEIIDAVHSEGGSAGIHCCGNTDWSLLLKTKIDVLSFDAYEFFDRLTLYPKELRKFLNRGGVLSWGIVPSLQPDMLEVETLDSLIAKIEGQIARLERIGLDADLIKRQSLITPSCGAGSLTEDLAERVLRLTFELSQALRKKL